MSRTKPTPGPLFAGMLVFERDAAGVWSGRPTEPGVVVPPGYTMRVRMFAEETTGVGTGTYAIWPSDGLHGWFLRWWYPYRPAPTGE
jgi:hypothetical protein